MPSPAISPRHRLAHRLPPPCPPSTPKDEAEALASKDNSDARVKATNCYRWRSNFLIHKGKLYKILKDGKTKPGAKDIPIFDVDAEEDGSDDADAAAADPVQNKKVILSYDV